jgi:hypothetical protein
MTLDKIILNALYLIIIKYSLKKPNLTDKNFIEYYDNRSTDIGGSSNSKKYYI